MQLSSRFVLLLALASSVLLLGVAAVEGDGPPGASPPSSKGLLTFGKGDGNDDGGHILKMHGHLLKRKGHMRGDRPIRLRKGRKGGVGLLKRTSSSAASMLSNATDATRGVISNATATIKQVIYPDDAPEAPTARNATTPSNATTTPQQQQQQPETRPVEQAPVPPAVAAGTTPIEEPAPPSSPSGGIGLKTRSNPQTRSVGDILRDTHGWF